MSEQPEFGYLFHTGDRSVFIKTDISPEELTESQRQTLQDVARCHVIEVEEQERNMGKIKDLEYDDYMSPAKAKFLTIVNFVSSGLVLVIQGLLVYAGIKRLQRIQARGG